MLYKNLIQDIRDLAEKHGVSLIHQHKPYVTLESIKCNGYFIDNPPTLAIATDRKVTEWKSILLHESCHMDQWIEQAPVWVDGYVNDTDPFEFISSWLDDDIVLGVGELDEYVRKLVAVELDCEKRSIKKILKYNLNIDEDVYAQKANAYLHFYNFMMVHKVWYEIGEEPYNNKAIYSRMPKTLGEDVDSYMNFNMIEIFREFMC